MCREHTDVDARIFLALAIPGISSEQITYNYIKIKKKPTKAKSHWAPNRIKHRFQDPVDPIDPTLSLWPAGC